MKTKQYYSYKEIKEILKEKTRLIKTDRDAISDILHAHSFLILKEISEVIKIIAKGK